MDSVSLERKYQRERRVRKQAELLLEEKSRELFETNSKLTLMLADLEKQVQKRTTEYKNAMLEAEAANKSKSDFLATMSHEIRTPLNGIISSLGLIKEKIRETEYRSHVEIAYNSGISLLEIINDILDLSKIESGHMELELSSFDLHQSINLVADLFRSRAEEKGLTLEVRFEQELEKWWEGDAGRIKQIILNFVSNAIKFTDKGAIIITAEKVSAEELRLSVSDDGIGIPADKLHLLFKDFQQVDTSYSRKFSGTGLGLSICRNLSELMGGSIGVESEPDEGSMFWVCLPLKRGTPLELEFKKVDEPEKLIGRILLAEDSSTNALVVQALLRLKQLNVDRVANGIDAVNAWRSKPYDLILMDLSMPEMDGFEATKKIRNEEMREQEIPVVALTANVSKEDLHECYSIGMNDVISKPIDRSELFSKLARWLPVVDGDATGEVPIRNGKSLSKTCVFSHEKFSDEWQDLPIRVQFDIISLFLDEMNEREVAILKHFRRKKWAAVRKEAHALKSAAGNIGANRLYALSAEIERNLECNNAEQSKYYANHLTEICVETATAINHHRERLKFNMSA